jgi:hypothetical protein
MGLQLLRHAAATTEQETDMTATKTVPMLTLVASLAVGLMLTTADVAFARDNNHNHSNNSDQQRHNNDQQRQNANGDRAHTEKRHAEKQKDKKSATMTSQDLAGKKKDQKKGKDKVDAAAPQSGTPVIHSGAIINKNAQPAAGTSANTLPLGGTVHITDGVNQANLSNGPGGLTVTNKDGKLQVTNGRNSIDMPGNSLTLSGPAVQSVGFGQGVQYVRHPNGDIAVVLAAPAPSANKPAPIPTSATVTGGPEGGFLHALGSGIWDSTLGHLSPTFKADENGPK